MARENHDKIKINLDGMPGWLPTLIIDNFAPSAIESEGRRYHRSETDNPLDGVELLPLFKELDKVETITNRRY